MSHAPLYLEAMQWVLRLEERLEERLTLPNSSLIPNPNPNPNLILRNAFSGQETQQEEQRSESGVD